MAATSAAWREYLHAIQEAAARPSATMGITMRGIVTCIRHFGPEKARADRAAVRRKRRGDFIDGFRAWRATKRSVAQGSSAGPSTGARGGPAAHRPCRRMGRAGKSCATPIRDLGVERIGHGVRAIEDMALVDEIAESGVVLEVCPGSNVALGIYPSFRKHPIGEMFDRGVKVTISTDDPPFFHTTMAREYDSCTEAFDWDDGVFAKIARTSLDAAFCDADTKTRIAENTGGKPMLEHLTVVTHPLVQHKLTLMREKDTSTASLSDLYNVFIILL